jgi:hypothetical protein
MLKFISAKIASNLSLINDMLVCFEARILLTLLVSLQILLGWRCVQSVLATLSPQILLGWRCVQSVLATLSPQILLGWRCVQSVLATLSPQILLSWRCFQSVLATLSPLRLFIELLLTTSALLRNVTP